MLTSTSSFIEFYLPSGTPSGIYDFWQYGISLTPTILSVSPSLGSSAGSIITAEVRGLGSDTKDVTLVRTDGTNMCSSVEVLASQVRCKTTTGTKVQDSLRLRVGTQLYVCSDLLLCNYETTTAMPTVSSFTTSGSNILVSGSNFLTSGFSAQLTYAGVTADSVSIDSASQVTATFNLGVPLSTSVKPVLWFESSAVSHWAINS